MTSADRSVRLKLVWFVFMMCYDLFYQFKDGGSCRITCLITKVGATIATYKTKFGLMSPLDFVTKTYIV